MTASLGQRLDRFQRGDVPRVVPKALPARIASGVHHLLAILRMIIGGILLSQAMSMMPAIDSSGCSSSGRSNAAFNKSVSP